MFCQAPHPSEVHILSFCVEEQMRAMLHKKETNRVKC